MKFYIIGTNAELRYSPFVRDFPTHLVLATPLQKDPETAEQVARLIQQGRQVILDNGAYEGELCPDIFYAKLAQQLQPWCVVLPDLVGADNIKSRETSIKSFYELQEKVPKARFMYVPQGKNKNQILEEFQYANENLSENFIIGIGKCYLYWGEDNIHRVQMIEDIRQNLGESINHEWHVLGARKTPTKAFAQYSNIIGIDTFKPVRYARAEYFNISPKEILHTHVGVISDKIIERKVNSFIDAYGLEDSSDAVYNGA